METRATRATEATWVTRATCSRPVAVAISRTSAATKMKKVTASPASPVEAVHKAVIAKTKDTSIPDAGVSL